MPIWTGAGADNNWSTAGNWDTGIVPNNATDAIFDGVTGVNPNKNCTITSGAICRNLNFTGYSGTVTFTNTLTVQAATGVAGSGAITFSSTMAVLGPNGIQHNIRGANPIPVTSNITTNGFNFNLPYTTSLENGGIVNLIGDFQVSNFNGVAIAGFTGNELRISGNFIGTASGLGIKVFNGTGTINGTVNNNIIFNTLGTITIGSSAIFNGNTTFTAGTIDLTNNFIHTSTSETITITSGITFTGSGNLVLRNVVFVNSTRTIVSNGVSWPNSLEIVSTSNNTNTLTLNDDLNVLGNFTTSGGSSSNTHTINGNTLYIKGNLVISNTGNGIAGTTNIVLDGSSNVNWTHVSAPKFENNLTINKSGSATVSISGNITWGTTNRTLQRTAGNINPGTSTVTIPNAAVTINNMVFNNLTITSGATITQNILNTINSTLLLSGNAIFAGTAGWNAAAFNAVVTSANTITLQAGVTYRVTNSLVLQGSSISTAQLTFQSSSATVKAIFTLDNGASQSVYFVRAIRIDSGLGQTIWDLPGTISPLLTDTINWNPGSRPAPVAYSYIL